MALRETLGKTTFTQVLGPTDADVARNWAKAHADYERLVKEAQKALAQSPPTMAESPLTLYRETRAHIRSLGFDPDDITVDEFDPASLALSEAREVEADAILDRYRNYSGSEVSRPLPPKDEMLVRALYSGSGSPPPPKLSDVVELYLKERPAQAKLKNRQRIDRAIRRLEKVVGKNADLYRVTRQEARSVREGLANDGLAPGTIKRVVGTLKTMLNLAKREYQLADWDNPFEKLDIPKDGAPLDKRHPIPASIRASILQTLQSSPRKPDFQLIWRLLDGTGCRLGEIVWCTVEDLKLDHAFPHINLVDRETSGTLLDSKQGGVKTDAGRRLVPLLGDALTAAREAVGSANGSDYIFPSYAHEGGPTTVSTSLMKYLRRHTAEKKHTVHSLRHNMADRLISAGVSEEVRNDILGHTQAGVGARTYGSRTARLEASYAAMEMSLALPESDDT